MLGRALHWLTGRQAGTRTGDGDRAAGQGRAGSGAVTARGAALADGAAPAAGSDQPVYSSRAVRDGAVVNAALDALRRFADGAEPAEALARRLAGLSAEQAASLQISAEAALLQRAIARAADLRGQAATDLNRLLAELAGGTPPRREAGDGAGLAGGVYGPRSVFGPLPRPPGPLAEMPPASGGLTGEVADFLPQAVPLPHSLERDSPPMPAPAPPPKGVAAGAPRLPRGAAEARRSRMSDTLAAALPPDSRLGPRLEHRLEPLAPGAAAGAQAPPSHILPPREDAR